MPHSLRNDLALADTGDMNALRPVWEFMFDTAPDPRLLSDETLNVLVASWGPIPPLVRAVSGPRAAVNSRPATGSRRWR